jgi:hypothetical protein
MRELYPFWMHVPTAPIRIPPRCLSCHQGVITMSTRFRRTRMNPQESHNSGSQKPEGSAVRLPLRWGVIILASCLAAAVVNSVAGPAAAIGAGIAVAVGLDRMLA